MTRTIRSAAATIAALVAALAACVALGEPPTYPTRPIRLITHSSAGSPPDIIARIIGERLAPVIGQPIVVENRPGASGTIGLAAVSKAQPDGYTLGTLTMSHMAAPGLVAQLSYDTVRDLAPVLQTTRTSVLLVVRGESPLRSISELVVAAKAQPGRLTYASGGNGTPVHLACEVFKWRAGIDIRHIPYKGALAAVAALLGQEVDLLSNTPSTVVGHIRSGRLRALATTGPVRLATFPDVPTLAELGFTDFDVRDWQGLVVPGRTPRSVIDRLASEISKLLTLSDVRERIGAIGMETVADSSPEAFAALIRSELPRWAKVVRETGMRLD